MAFGRPGDVSGSGPGGRGGRASAEPSPTTTPASTKPTSTRIAAAGITTGCGPGLYCPGSGVTREQMATFLARALRPAAGGQRPLHRHRRQHPRRQHQCHRRRRDHHRMLGHAFLPDPGGDPRPDGYVSGQGPRAARRAPRSPTPTWPTRPTPPTSPPSPRPASPRGAGEPTTARSIR